MKFKVQKERLLQVLQHVRKVISAREAIPIFEDMYFTFDDSMMTVEASDGEQRMEETLSVESLEEPRTFSVWPYTLIRAIKGMEDQMLTFEVGEYQMTVNHSCGSFRVPIKDGAEYMDMRKDKPDIESDRCETISYEAPGLRSILTKCRFAMANDELRPALNGVVVNLTKHFADYASSDGHVLARIRKEPIMYGNKKQEVTFIIPSKVVNTLLKILPSTGDVDIVYQEAYKEKGEDRKEHRAVASIFIDDEIVYTFYPIDGRFPNYNNVIPTAHLYEIKANRKGLIKSLERLTNFTSNSGMIELVYDNDLLKMEAKDVDLEIYGNEGLPIEVTPKMKSPIRQGMKDCCLLPILKTLTTENVIIKVTDASRAVIIEPDPQPTIEKITMLLMPMMKLNATHGKRESIT